uniref:O-methyltransferase domain-containing protein n=1 Tax=Araucaria cunninghamii TaxID=56994 RepID=A0A0D6QU46_ARACU
MNGPLPVATNSRGHALTREEQLFESEEEQLAGQAEAWRYTFAFVESVAVKSVVLLGIPDMIARHGPNGALSLSEIVAALPSPSPNVACLFRILRFLVAKKFFSAHIVTKNGEMEMEMRYGLTPASKWMVKENETSLVPMFLMQNDGRSVAPWHHFDECVLEGGIAFERANGAHIWDYASSHLDYNRLFNEAMACSSKIVMKAVLSKYKGFDGLTSLVDVGGGTGTAIAEIVRAYPRIRGFNYDLPHVVATASKLQGVEHIGGDMFESVPSADAVFMKCIMHDWGDEECIRILKNCRKAIPETGKVIIVDVVLDAREKGVLDPTLGLVSDLVMVAHSSGGKERTDQEWKHVLAQGGFGRYNIIGVPALQSIIEAFP